MRVPLPLLLVLAGCGASVAPEPYQLPASAKDLTPTTYQFQVFMNADVQAATRSAPIDTVEVERASLTNIEGYSTTSDFPVKIAKTFAVGTPAIAPDGNSLTFEFSLQGPPSAKLYARILGLKGGIRGVACLTGVSVGGPRPTHVTLVPPPGPPCDIP